MKIRNILPLCFLLSTGIVHSMAPISINHLVGLFCCLAATRSVFVEIPRAFEHTKDMVHQGTLFPENDADITGIRKLKYQKREGAISVVFSPLITLCSAWILYKDRQKLSLENKLSLGFLVYLFGSAWLQEKHEPPISQIQ